jgi:hypothetical protein
MEFQELRSHFEIVRKRFEQAETLEEKLQLLAISKQIISAADGQNYRVFGETRIRTRSPVSSL